MKIQNILFLLFLLSMQSMAIGNSSNLADNASAVLVAEDPCILPSPSPLNVDGVGSTWISVNWNVVSGASAYRLQAFDATNGDPLAGPVFVSGTTTNADVPTGGAFGLAFVKIQTVCPDGSLSEPPTLSNAVQGIIIELVATGKDLQGAPPTQPVGYGRFNGVYIDWTGDTEYFMVHHLTNSSLTRSFALEVAPSSNPNVVRVFMGLPESGKDANAGHNVVYDAERDAEGVPVNLLVRYRANKNDPVETAPIVATLEAMADPSANGYGKFYRTFTNNNPDWQILHFITNAGPGGNLKIGKKTSESEAEAIAPEDRSSLEALTPALSARPNPFHNAIVVQLPESKTENARMMHLYDLLGARRLSYQVPANQTECTLNTSLLTPGVYFLRIETDGKMETIKLLKTE